MNQIDALPGVELRHLRALVTIAETSSFSRAAERLGYAQSALSHQIAALERAVGAPLVTRPGGPRPVSLTEAGVVAARHAERVLGALAALRADLKALAAGEAGTLRVGTFQSTGERLLPGVLAGFSRDWPGVRVELTHRVDGGELLELVAGGDLDVTFAIGAEDDDRFDLVPLLDDPWVVLAPPGSPLAEAPAVELGRLDGQAVVGWNLPSRCQDLVDEALRRAGAAPVVVFRTDDNLTLQRLVGAGLGHAVVAELTVERGPHAGPAVVLPIADALRPRTINLYSMRGRRQPPALRAFVEAVRALAVLPGPASDRDAPPSAA